MSILRYIPKQSAINDRRTPEGGFYEATCRCGNKFYPKRSDALYCSNRCAVQANREAKKEKEKQERIENALRIAQKYIR